MLLRATIAGLVLGAATSVAAATTNGDDHPHGSYLLRVGKIYTGAAVDPSGAPVDPQQPAVYEPGELYVVDGKIAAIGKDLDVPSSVTVHDAPDAVIMPGAVLASTQLAGNASSGLSGNAAGSFNVNAHLMAADGLDLFANFETVLLSGVTTAYLSTGRDRIVSGQGAVAKLGGAGGRARMLVPVSQLEVNLVPSALNPPALLEIPIPPSSDNPILPAVTQLPSSPVSQRMALDEAVAAARAGSELVPLRALAQALEARRPLRIVAQDGAELLKALEIADAWGLKTTLVGATGADEVVTQLGAAGRPVVVEIGLDFSNPADAPDPGVAAQLAGLGLRVAISPPPGNLDVFSTGALARRGGMSVAQAVAAMTSIPAEILGVADHVGTLKTGMDADFLMLSGEPFHRGSHVDSAVIDGVVAARRHEHGEADERPVVLRAGHVLIGDGSEMQDASILMQGGKILAVGRDVAVPPGARVIDLGADAYLTPGFIDCNSQIELEGDRGAMNLDLDPTMLVASAGDEALDVARAGITTALVQAAADPSSNGTRVVAVKTAGHSREQRVVSHLAAIKYSWRGTVDPVPLVARFKGALGNGKKYHDSWVKHYEELAKWEEEQKKKQNDEEAKKAEEAPKKQEEVVEEAVTEKKADPITGRWEVEISGGPIPEPQAGEMTLKLSGENVTGTFSGLFGDGAELTGTFDGTVLRAELVLEGGPPFEPTLELTLAGEDSLQGTLALGDRFSFDVSATRVEKTLQEVTTVTKRKKKGADGRPVPPTVNPALEPYRQLYAGECVVLLDIDQALSMKYALPLFQEMELPLVLMNAEGGLRVVDEFPEVLRGVVVPQNLVSGNAARPKVLASDYAAAGVHIALQSGAGRGARGLPVAAAWAVRQGLSPSVALQALTHDAAAMFGIEDRVGTLTAGKDADVLCFIGHPFELSSRLERVYVGGDEVEMEVDD